MLIAIFAFPLTTRGLLAQEIKIKTENGITVVYNPKEPVPIKGQPSKLTLREDLTIGKDTEDTNYMFSGLQHCQVDEQEYMVAADWKEAQIRIYDKNGKHVRSFGRKGQGPGEIGLPYYLGIFQGNKIVVHDQMNGKFIICSREGELLKEIPMGKYRFITRFKYDYISKDGNQLDRYDVFDPEGRYIAKFYHPRAETAQAIRKNKFYVRVEEEVYGLDLLRRYSLIWE